MANRIRIAYTSSEEESSEEVPRRSPRLNPEPKHIVINLPVNTETMTILETLSTDEVAECAKHALESLSKEELIELMRASAVIPVQFPPPLCVDFFDCDSVCAVTDHGQETADKSSRATGSDREGH